MRALTYEAFQRPLRVVDVPEPQAPPGAAVVRVLATGLCRSDWHGWMGHDTDIQTFPHIPGHEFAGEVLAVGDGVPAEWLGRQVTAPFVFACGACATCRAGNGQVCPAQRQPGFSDPGSFAEQVVVFAATTNLIALPPGLSPALAAALGCRVATAYRAVTARGRVTSDDTVLVFGCGGVGLAAIEIAAGRGARVCAIDLDAGARDLAQRHGAEHAVDAAQPEPDLIAELVEWSGGGAAVAVDAIGSPTSCRAGILALGRRGRHVQVGLLPPAAGDPRVPMDRVIAWELDLLGSHGMAAADYPPLLADVAAGRLDLAGLLAADPPMGLAEAGPALAALADTPSRGIRLIDPGT